MSAGFQPPDTSIHYLSKRGELRLVLPPTWDRLYYRRPIGQVLIHLRSHCSSEVSPVFFLQSSTGLPVKWSWTVISETAYRATRISGDGRIHSFSSQDSSKYYMIWMKAIINSENVLISKHSFCTAFWSLKPSDKRSRRYLHQGFQLFQVLCWNHWKKVLVKMKS